MNLPGLEWRDLSIAILGFLVYRVENFIRGIKNQEIKIQDHSIQIAKIEQKLKDCPNCQPSEY